MGRKFFFDVQVARFGLGFPMRAPDLIGVFRYSMAMVNGMCIYLGHIKKVDELAIVFVVGKHVEESMTSLLRYCYARWCQRQAGYIL